LSRFQSQFFIFEFLCIELDETFEAPVVLTEEAQEEAGDCDDTDFEDVLEEAFGERVTGEEGVETGVEELLLVVGWRRETSVICLFPRAQVTVTRTLSE
jgi:hypothetical protein